MITEKIDLYKYFNLKRPDGANGYLYSYVQDVANNFDKDRRRPAIVICPGGGYSWLSDREKEPIALQFVALSYNAFVLEYSVKPLCYPTQLIEAAMAVVYIRENADKLFVRSDKVAIAGFSAGGHLACSLSTLFNDNALGEVFKDKLPLARPDGAALCYPVITADERFWHDESIKFVSGFDKAVMQKMSLENQVTKDTVPTFIWHTAKDGLVPVMNSLLLAQKLNENGVDFELHVFETGDHGLGLATRETACYNEDCSQINEDVAKWVPLADKFLKRKGFIIR